MMPISNQLFPCPQSVRFSGDAFFVHRLEYFEARGFSSLEVTNRLPGAFDDLGFVSGGSIFRIERKAVGASGAYHLLISEERIELSAEGLAGLRYGLDTLAQLLRSWGGRIPCLEIRDYPDFKHRAYLLDLSRCKVPTMVSLKKLIRQLAALRYNQLQLYVEHTFAFKNHEIVWKDASPLTAVEIRELDAYAADHDIELVPCFNSFGHFERWLRHEPYRHLAESPDGFVHPIDGKRRPWGSTLKPDSKSLELLSELYAEFLPNFSSVLFNVGGDEPWELGKGASRAKVGREGEGRVYLDFLLQIHREASRQGRRMLFWGDLINRYPELIPELPDDSIALNWGYEADAPLAEQLPHFAEAGLEFYVCPGTSAWCSLTGRWTNARENLIRSAVEGKANGALGYLLTDWGDGGHHQIPAITWPGLVAGALYSWCARSNRDLPIPEAIDLLIQDEDLASGTGELLCRIGELIDLGGWHFPNRGLFHELLFENEYKPDFLSRFAGLDDAALALFAGAIQELDKGLQPLGKNSLLRFELSWTLAVCRLALVKFAHFSGQTPPAFDVWSLRRFVLAEYERLWRARNRPGGYDESYGVLEAALEFASNL